jgi:hypothetical protein
MNGKPGNLTDTGKNKRGIAWNTMNRKRGIEVIRGNINGEKHHSPVTFPRMMLIRGKVNGE